MCSCLFSDVTALRGDRRWGNEASTRHDTVASGEGRGGIHDVLLIELNSFQRNTNTSLAHHTEEQSITFLSTVFRGRRKGRKGAKRIFSGKEKKTLVGHSSFHPP